MSIQQEIANRTKKQEETTSPELLKQFEALKNKQVTSLTRTVRLRFTLYNTQEVEMIVQGCGCFGSTTETVTGETHCLEIELDRDVDIDSNYKDGDTAHSIKEGDRFQDIDAFKLLD